MTTNTSLFDTISDVSYSIVDKIIMSKLLTILVFFYVSCCYVMYKLMLAGVSTTYIADAVYIAIALPISGLAWQCSERYAIEIKNPTEYDVPMTRWVYLGTTLFSVGAGFVFVCLAV